ncbi:hypothetical protein HII31_02546 [Pseudocercospora fuligena]|uniref:Ecp2 effector protein domain-containing protein n=1 Tax=Pseudocercospora fuligena TaxID=685502 RepID=A0A8H6VRE8_9PEZI|nr:hypothetical protein HII31_02546 [Pseudocercospora fuligena]
MRIKVAALVAVTTITASLAMPLQLGDTQLTSEVAARDTKRGRRQIVPADVSPVDGTWFSDHIFNDQAVCTLTFDSHGIKYDIHIGRPYINGAGCDPIFDTMSAHVNTEQDDSIILREDWKCDDDKHGNTRLGFTVNDGAHLKDANTQYRVIEALGQAYPDVPFVSERICLVGSPAPNYWPPVASAPSASRRRDVGLMQPREELDPWGTEWAIAKLAASAEDPLHMFVAETNVTGVVGYLLQINHPSDVCEYFLSTLRQQALKINERGCRADSQGGTQIKFTAGLQKDDLCQPGIYDKINEAFPDLRVLEKAPRLFGVCQPPKYWPHST